MHRKARLPLPLPLLLTLAVCAPTLAWARGDTTRLVAALQNDALTLDPSRDQSTIGLTVFNNVFEGLTGINKEGGLEPRLATAWTVSPDARTWTFTLRKGATFHDGTPVTPADAAWSYQKILDDPTSPLRLYLTLVSKVETVGEDQVRFTLSAPFAPFDRQVSLISIMPRAAYERAGAQEFGRHPVGSGPYQVANWVKDDRLELQAFAQYWGGAPAIANVVLRPIPSEASRSAALLSGELDVVPGLPPALVQRLSAAPNTRIESIPTNRVLYLAYNLKTPPLDRLEVRQAIDMAIDRDAITGKLLRGMGRPAGELLAPVTFGYDGTLRPTRYDPDKARALLKAAGYAGQPVLIEYPNNRDAFAEQVVQAIAGYMKDVGLKVDLHGMEYGAFFPIWSSNKIQAMDFFAFGPITMDAEVPLVSLLETGSHGYWNNPQVDELVRAQRAETDPAKRRALIGRIMQLSHAELPYSALYQEVQAYGVSKGLSWSPRPDGLMLFKDASWESK